jgi:hypothetical protein
MSSEVFHHGNGSKINRRRYPGIKGKRPDRKAIRQAEAVQRAQAYAVLSLSEKKLRNPKKFL